MSKRSGGAGETLRTVIYAVLIALVVRTFAYEPFNIPSGSMVPTLLVGDYLFVSKFSYGYSRHSLPFSLPLFSGRVLSEAPKRGEVAVFKTPADNATDYIKRVIGLPGDRVQMRQGRLFINGVKVERRRLGAFSYRDHKSGAIIRITRYEEILPGGARHPILEATDGGPYDNTREFTVPEGHYFMMGDNRDNSVDSRATVGFVPLENFIGRAEMIFFSTDGTARLWEVWKWFTAIRYGRLFGTIE